MRFVRPDALLARFKQSRFDNSRDAVLADLCAVDLLSIDDFALEPMGREETRDVYQRFVERNARASILVTSNRDTNEWLATFDDMLLAQKRRRSGTVSVRAGRDAIFASFAPPLRQSPIRVQLRGDFAASSRTEWWRH